MEREGVTKYRLTLKNEAFPFSTSLLQMLNDCRRLLQRYGWLGADPDRYEGLGFGNVSVRRPDNVNHFIISGSQTGHLECLDACHWACVTESDMASNSLSATGLTAPSSEALSHGVFYRANAQVNAVVHIHCPHLWLQSRELLLPETSVEAEYGTKALAEQLYDLANHITASASLVVALRGHQDGIIAAGPSLHACSDRLVGYFQNIMDQQ